MNLLVSLLLFLFMPNTATVVANVDANQDKAVTEIVIESNDQMKFNLSEIKVEAGTTVKLTLKHVGKLPKQAMGHNFVLLTQGTEMKEFAMSATQARDNNYVPEGSENVIASTIIIGGGESTTIEFEAPAKGTYTFICTFPGHYALMNGTFVVE